MIAAMWFGACIGATIVIGLYAAAKYKEGRRQRKLRATEEAKWAKFLEDTATLQTNKAGRPRFNIDMEAVHTMRKAGICMKEIARTQNCTASGLYKRMKREKV